MNIKFQKQEQSAQRVQVLYKTSNQNTSPKGLEKFNSEASRSNQSRELDKKDKVQKEWHSRSMRLEKAEKEKAKRWKGRKTLEGDYRFLTERRL